MPAWLWRAGFVVGAGALTVALSLGGCIDLSEPEVQGLEGTRGNLGEGFRCAAPPSMEDESLVIHFVDVGQGDGIWIRTPDDGEDGNGEMEGLEILIDTGIPAFDREDGEPGLADYLAQHGLPAGGRIDYLLATHAHLDHYGGAVEIMEAYDVENIGDPGFENDENVTWAQYVSRAEAEVSENGGRLLRPFVGTFVDQEYDTSEEWGSELEVRVLNSESELSQGDTRSRQIDNTSIVLQITYAGRSVLLMGDAGVETEDDILEAVPDLRAEVLKVGHHGSTSSSSEAFIERVFSEVPELRRVAVISSGLKSFNGVQLPAQSTIDRVLGFVPAETFYSTEFEDAEDGQTESTAAGDDHVVVIISADGDITSCYAE